MVQVDLNKTFFIVSKPFLPIKKGIGFSLIRLPKQWFRVIDIKQDIVIGVDGIRRIWQGSVYGGVLCDEKVALQRELLVCFLLADSYAGIFAEKQIVADGIMGAVV